MECDSESRARGQVNFRQRICRRPTRLAGITIGTMGHRRMWQRERPSISCSCVQLAVESQKVLLQIRGFVVELEQA
jgi:hypothetical protein